MQSSGERDYFVLHVHWVWTYEAPYQHDQSEGLTSLAPIILNTTDIYDCNTAGVVKANLSVCARACTSFSRKYWHCSCPTTHCVAAPALLTYTNTNCATLWCSSFSGADMECKTSMHFTPLLAGIRYTKPKPVFLLLSHGANVMARDKRRWYNALLWAVEIQNLEILKVFTVVQIVRLPYPRGNNTWRMRKPSFCWKFKYSILALQSLEKCILIISFRTCMQGYQ